MKIKVFFLFIGLFFFSLQLSAQDVERIINFDVVVTVNEDRSLDVKEYIHVYATGSEIKRGIARSLPSSRRMQHGSLKMTYDIIEITKNDVTEPYFTQAEGSVLTVYIGEKNVFLQPGEYSYMIHYTVQNQIGFFKNYDELYWNAIGLDVKFMVENASCKVRLPSGAEIIQESAYVGRYGTKGKEYDVTPVGSILDYRLKKSLKPHEGFTVAIGFEKGFVNEPSFFTRYGTAIIIGVGSFFLLFYYLYTWWRYGRDPESPEVFMEYQTPKQLSPASINYILNEGKNSNRGFTASVVSLAVKGFLKIEEFGKSGFFGSGKNYRLLELKKPDSSLPKEEAIIMNKLFAGNNQLTIDGKYNSYVQKAMNLHRDSLNTQHKEFINKGNNLRFIILPIILSIFVGVLGFFAFESSPYTYSINMVYLAVFAVVALLSLFLYTYLIKQPTVEKLDLRSKIKGFKMYIELLDDFESGSDERPNPTADHFEKILPYAFALGIESQWTNKFKAILEKSNYEPDWNNSMDSHLFYYGFGNNFSTRSAASSVKPVESSGGGFSGGGFSGSGGGGFSGGGGGGGGVGGW